MPKKHVCIQEALLGFDARVFLGVSPEWTTNRRRRFLLRDDVRRPIATDTAVWPSVFGDGLSEAERERLGVANMNIPAWRGPNRNLWDDLERMRGVLHGVATTHQVISVSWVSWDAFSRRSITGAPYLETMTPAILGAGWSMLGLDIADGSLTSGLSNCAYSANDRAKLRRRWASRLNEHHLFDDVAAALEFSDVTEKRVPEHAPFFVYALRVLSDTLRQ